jgi:hypothetical protein
MNFNSEKEAQRYAESYVKLNVDQRDYFRRITETVNLVNATPVKTRPPYNVYFFV